MGIMKWLRRKPEKIEYKLPANTEALIRALGAVGYSSDDLADLPANLRHLTDLCSPFGNPNRREWIFCSDRLPDVPPGTEDDMCPEFNVMINGAVLPTTLKCDPTGIWFDDLGEVYDVIAWQQLPDPCIPKEPEDEQKEKQDKKAKAILVMDMPDCCWGCACCSEEILCMAVDGIFRISESDRK